MTISVRRINLNLTETTFAALSRIATEDEIGLTEAIRKAITLYDLIRGEKKLGRELVTTDARGRTKELWLI